MAGMLMSADLPSSADIRRLRALPFGGGGLAAACNRWRCARGWVLVTPN